MAYNPFDQNWDSLNPFKRPEVDTSEADAAALIVVVFMPPRVSGIAH